MHSKRNNFIYPFNLIPTERTREVMYFATSSEHGNIFVPSFFAIRTICVEVGVQLEITQLII